MCLFYSMYHFLSLAVNHCHLLSLAVICCHWLYHLLSLAVTYCHLLSRVVIRCHSLYHSLPFVVTRCHSLSLVVPFVVTRCHSLSLVVTRCTSRPSFYKQCVNSRPCLCTPYLSLLFFYLLTGPVKDHVKYQRRKLLQQQKAANQDLFYPLAVPISNNGLFEKT